MKRYDLSYLDSQMGISFDLEKEESKDGDWVRAETAAKLARAARYYAASARLVEEATTQEYRGGHDTMSKFMDKFIEYNNKAASLYKDAMGE